MANGTKGFETAVNPQEFTGGCQCGAVRYRIRAERLACYACHCRECQKQSASAFGISVPVAQDNFTLEGEVLMWRRPTDSGSFTNCYFCAECGTRIYHAGESRPSKVTIKGGSLDNASELAPVAHIWTISKQAWVVLPEGIPQWDKQPENADEWTELLA
ncbi:GFA family protein [Erythrobacter sp. F6033]|uniref:GFA family protein n=1 Tax=Erythrobacter sp. F6033 TaxID=2926401 RepID=UPI001FF5541E|nr:GFA family protein [Erythrobacter sp. F6033]MCK0128139.1 GFA family protein [Erythrobacter sp. F6033]